MVLVDRGLLQHINYLNFQAIPAADQAPPCFQFARYSTNLFATNHQAHFRLFQVDSYYPDC